MVAPLARASSTWASMPSTAAALISGPTSVAGSNGSPTDRASMAATNRSVNSSATSAWTMNRLAAMHDWPPFWTRACTATGHGPVEVGRREDDERVAPAELEDDLLTHRPGLGGHGPAGADATR